MELPFLSATLPEIIAAVGYVGIFIIVFIESGVPIGLVVPLPGDTLLFSAGLLAAGESFSLVPLLITIVSAAILGDSAGYWFGKTYGPKLFSKKDALFLNPRHLARAERFYEKYGRLSIVIARFLPVLRTLVPLAAGMGRMRYDVFLRYNILGAFVWGVSLTLLGYYLGSLIPNIDHYLLPIVLLVVVVCIALALREIYTAKKERETPPTGGV